MSRKLVFRPPPTGDKNARKEDAQLSQDKDFARIAAENEHGRSQTLKDAFLWGIIRVIVIIFLSICAAIAVVVIHMLGPDWMRWLKTEEVVSLQKMLSVLLVSGLLADYTRTLLLK
ncbi:hypothetical protein [Lysobacter capsici]|uniref:hypothetical protein n=1 Tax=Lysobacter capsici TaxID=435897 RepID=UPI001C003E6B|nr:hypothetical protein [Lysobacter capsici]QWF18145.1 hypothetical protein KME82_05095 [Lysobacter capsici]